jgi:hypothetical protein
VIVHIVRELLALQRELKALRPLPEHVLHPGPDDR